MKLSVNQGTKEWLEIRKKSITSTDSSIILGLNPYKDKEKLLLQKLDLEPVDDVSEIMMMGTQLEPIARERYMEETGELVFPAVYIRDDLPWAMASLDGINFDEDKIIEIKCGSKAFDRGSNIPPYYYCQIQHALWVSGATKCDYFCYWLGNFKLVTIEKDYPFIEKMIEAEKEFFCEMENADLEKLGIETRDDEAFEEAAQRWKEANKVYLEAKALLKRAETVEKEAKSDMASLICGRGAIGFGIKIRKISRIGNIDYSLIPELQGVDLEKYRKEKSYWWDISEIRNEDKLFET